MRRQKLDWKQEIDKKELRYGVLMLLLYLVGREMILSSEPATVKRR